MWDVGNVPILLPNGEGSHIKTAVFLQYALQCHWMNVTNGNFSIQHFSYTDFFWLLWNQRGTSPDIAQIGNPRTARN